MIVVISESYSFETETSLVNELFHLGLDYFHLRKYNWTEQELVDFTQQIEHQFLDRLVFCQRYELGASLGVNHFHLSEQTRIEWADANWNMMNPLHSYSTSVHELATFNQLGNRFEYAFLSPIFDSISKPEYKANSFDLALREDFSTKLIALGGISAENVNEAMKLGFDGIALLGAIWKSEQPTQAFLSVKKQMEMISKA
jgi:thiamine-phosphate pyrophosphorylase